MSARNRLIAQCDHITTLRWTLGFLILLTLGQQWHIHHLRQIQRIYLPPDLSAGAELEINRASAPTIYTFAFYIWQQLNRWAQDGEMDYPKQLYALQGFLTPRCIDAITTDVEAKRRKGELRERSRSLQAIPGRGFDSERVHQRAQGRWLTWLDVQLQETLGYHPVKDIYVRYALPVVRFDVDREINPWGLAIDCEADFVPELLNKQTLQTPFQAPESMPEQTIERVR